MKKDESLRVVLEEFGRNGWKVHPREQAILRKRTTDFGLDIEQKHHFVQRADALCLDFMVDFEESLPTELREFIKHLKKREGRDSFELVEDRLLWYTRQVELESDRWGSNTTAFYRTMEAHVSKYEIFVISVAWVIHQSISFKGHSPSYWHNRYLSDFCFLGFDS